MRELVSRKRLSMYIAYANLAGKEAVKSLAVHAFNSEKYIKPYILEK